MQGRLLALFLLLLAAGALPSVTGAQSAEPPVDLLTLAEGAVVLSASANAPAALSLTDGDAKTAWNNGGPKHPLPQVFVFELRAPTLVSHVGIDNAGPRPGGVAGAAVRTVGVEGSAESLETGFVPLATIEAAADGETLVAVAPAGPLRWLRFTVESTQNPEATWAYFDEAIAQGTQTPPEGERFTGVFALGPKAFIELQQSGMQISGCYVEDGGHSLGEVAGEAVDGVARLRWRRTDKADVQGVALLVVDSRGNLNGVRYRDRSRAAWGGPPAPAGTTTPCSAEPAPSNPVADALEEDGSVRLYGILFDFDQATLKPASEPALQQLLAALQAVPALRVEIAGHTDSDGNDAYNLALSQRRAESVVAWLVERGIAASRLVPVGKGESEPVAGNATADGRALNRRVEVRRL